MQPLTKPLQLSDPFQAEARLLSGLSGEPKLLVQQAFQLAAAALKKEPNEWPAQILARLQAEPRRAIQKLLKTIEGPASGWLRPVVASLIRPGGPILKISNPDLSASDTRSLVWNQETNQAHAFLGNSFRKWDLNQDQELSRLDLPMLYGDAAIADPPNRAVVMAQQRQLLLVDFEKLTAEAIFNEGVLERIAISADGNWAVSASVPPDWDYESFDWNGPRTLRLFDLQGKRLAWTWQAHRAFLQDLALSANGRFLATGSLDCTVKLFDLQAHLPLATWRCDSEVQAVAITPSGSRVAYSSRGGVLTFRRRNGKILGRYQDCRTETGCLALSGDGRKAVGVGGNEMFAVNLAQPSTVASAVSPQSYVTSLRIDSRATYAITGESSEPFIVWQLNKLKGVEPMRAEISSVWASNDLALIQSDALSLWSLCSGTYSRFAAPKHSKIAAAPSAGVWAISSLSSGGRFSVRIGKWGKKKTVPIFKSVDSSSAFPPNLGFSRDGSRLVVDWGKSELRVFDVSSGLEVWQPSDLPAWTHFALSPTGRFLLSWSLGGETQVYDVDQKQLFQTHDLQGIHTKVIFAKDEDSIFVGQAGWTQRLDWRTGSRSTLCLGNPVAISDDASWLLTETDRRRLILWELPNARLAGTYTLDLALVEAALSPDGRYVVAADEGGGIHILRREP